MKTLTISPELSLPMDAVTQTFAILGIRGSGKTNTAVSVAEEMLKLGYQIVVLDPTDAWYGLRSSRDGKSGGFKVTILGGEHGDLPLDGSNGKILADFVVESGASVVFSLRHLSISEQRKFATEFGERLYDMKGKPEFRTPLHIFVDEADEFIPQRIPPGHERMFGAYDRLVRRGRSSGIGLTMISQRPQVLNKDTLSQCETLICHRLLHKLDRKAVKEGWVEGHDTEGQAGTFMDSLSSLDRGDAWCWSPSWLDIFKRVHIRQRETFDSSFTPKAGEGPKTAARLAEVDLDDLKAKLSATIEKAKQDDPKELKRQIAELRRELAKKPAVAAASVETVEVKVPVIDQKDLEELRKFGYEVATMADRAAQCTEAIAAMIKKIDVMQDRAQNIPKFIPTRTSDLRHGFAIPADKISSQSEKPNGRAAPGIAQRKDGHGDQSLPRGERATLIAIAQYGQIERDTLTVLTGYKRSSRDAYIQRLRERGLVDLQGSNVIPTQAGVDALGSDYEPLPVGEALQEYWLQRLPEGEKRVLEILLGANGKSIPRDVIDENTGYKRSSRDAYLQRLSSRRLVESVGRGEVKAAEVLFS